MQDTNELQRHPFSDVPKKLKENAPLMDTADQRIYKNKELAEEAQVSISTIKRAKRKIRERNGEIPPIEKQEWITPPDILESARSTMGGEIGFDPASSHKAQKFVREKKFLTPEADALNPDTPWYDKIWLNPPNDFALISKFADRLVSEIESGNVSEAIWLSNNATEKPFFQKLLKISTVVCFLRGSKRYLDRNFNEKYSPHQGQILLVFGRNLGNEKIAENFSDLGHILLMES